MSECITWKEGDIVWNLTDFTWSEICLLLEIVTPTIQGGGYSGQLSRLKKRNKEDQKTFIKLICKVNRQKKAFEFLII